jgi:DNA-directed RNA polymerase subunit RPC12/RpoP
MSNEGLQFDRAEYAQPAATRVSCATCSREIVQSYYEVGGKIICSDCRERREHGLEGGGFVRFLRASGAGLGAAVLGAVLWYGVRALTGYEVGLISIAVGIGVGKAVAWGAHGKGGWLYQLLALFLTYTSIVTNYVPDIVQGMVGEGMAAGPFVYVVAFLISYAAPFLMGFQNIVGMLIIAFGLWEAWKINKRSNDVVSGPFSVTPAQAPIAPAAANV